LKVHLRGPLNLHGAFRYVWPNYKYIGPFIWGPFTSVRPWLGSVGGSGMVCSGSGHSQCHWQEKTVSTGALDDVLTISEGSPWNGTNAIYSWLRSTVGRTLVFGRRTDPVLRSTFS